MESIPRITSLSFPLRRPGPDHSPDFRSQIKTFIQDHYGEDCESYNKEITELESLRSAAVHPTLDNSGCALLKKYFCQLNFLRSRFPIREQGPCIISFSWTNVFTDVVNNHSNIDFEMASILYNIGSLHSTLGSLANRETPEGIKEACTHFQCSAWAFQNLRQNQSKYLQYFSPDDITGEIIGLMQALCLAQAQECILEKSFIDKRKSTINVKVAIQIHEFYANIIKSLENLGKESTKVKLGDKLVKQLKKWKQMSELKLNFYNAISYLYLGLQAEEDKKMGIRITFYEASKDKLTLAFKLAKSLDKNDSIHETLNFTCDYVTGKLSDSQKDNDSVYHEKVPDLNEANLSEIRGVSLVKGIPFKFDDHCISGPDIFARLIPMETHEASSLYSEEKAKILRNYCNLCEKRNESLENFLVTFLCDQLELTISNEDLQELIDSCASLNVDRDAVGKLTSMMTHLSGMFVDVESSLKEIEDIFIIEDGKEAEYNELMKGIPDKNGGSNQNQNNILVEIRSEYSKYAQAQGLASKTNQTLYEVMSDHVSNLQILVQPFDEVLKVIPSQPDLSEKDSQVIEEIHSLRSQLDSMQTVRKELENQLRESVINDDITKVLIVNENQDLQQVFHQELGKHSKITQQLDVNFTLQDTLLKQIEEHCIQLKDLKKAHVNLKEKRQNKISQLLVSHQSYEELLSKCTKGLDFYEKLRGNLEILVKRLKSAITIEEERREMNLNSILGTRVGSSGVISTVPSIDFNLEQQIQVPSTSTTSTTSTNSSSSEVITEYRVETPPPSYSYVVQDQDQGEENSVNSSVNTSISSISVPNSALNSSVKPSISTLDPILSPKPTISNISMPNSAIILSPKPSISTFGPTSSPRPLISTLGSKSPKPTISTSNPALNSIPRPLISTLGPNSSPITSISMPNPALNFIPKPLISTLGSISTSSPKPKLKDYLDMMKNDNQEGLAQNQEPKMIKEYLDMINKDSGHISPVSGLSLAVSSVSIPAGPGPIIPVHQPKLKDYLDRMRHTDYQLELAASSSTSTFQPPTVQPKLKDYLEKMKNTGVSKPHLDMIQIQGYNYRGQGEIERSNNYDIPQMYPSNQNQIPLNQNQTLQNHNLIPQNQNQTLQNQNQIPQNQNQTPQNQNQIPQNQNQIPQNQNQIPQNQNQNQTLQNVTSYDYDNFPRLSNYNHMSSVPIKALNRREKREIQELDSLPTPTTSTSSITGSDSVSNNGLHSTSNYSNTANSNYQYQPTNTAGTTGILNSQPTGPENNQYYYQQSTVPVAVEPVQNYNLVSSLTTMTPSYTTHRLPAGLNQNEPYGIPISNISFGHSQQYPYEYHQNQQSYTNANNTNTVPEQISYNYNYNYATQVPVSVSVPVDYSYHYPAQMSENTRNALQNTPAVPSSRIENHGHGYTDPSYYHDTTHSVQIITNPIVESAPTPTTGENHGYLNQNVGQGQVVTRNQISGNTRNAHQNTPHNHTDSASYYHDNTHSVQIITNPIVESAPTPTTGENYGYLNENVGQGQVNSPESTCTRYENESNISSIPSGSSSVSVLNQNYHNHSQNHGYLNENVGQIVVNSPESSTSTSTRYGNESNISTISSIPSGSSTSSTSGSINQNYHNHSTSTESPIYDNSTLNSGQKYQVYTSVPVQQVEQPFFSNYYYQQSLLDKPTSVHKSDSLIMSFPITGGSGGQANTYQNQNQTVFPEQSQSYFPITNSYQQQQQQHQQQGYYNHSAAQHQYQYPVTSFGPNSSQQQHQLGNYQPSGYSQNYAQYSNPTTANDGISVVNSNLGYSVSGSGTSIVQQQQQQQQPHVYYEQHVNQQQQQVQNHQPQPQPQQSANNRPSNIDLLESLNDVDSSTISVPLTPVQVTNSTTTVDTDTTSENQDSKQSQN